MRSLHWWGVYPRDIKRLTKRGYDLSKLYAIVDVLRDDGMMLPETTRPHKLSGEYDGLWECHIGHDWLLIYKTVGNKLLLARTGTHEDLFW